MNNTIEQFINDTEIDEVSKKVCCANVVTVPTRIPEEKLKAIGMIIARFQRLEITIIDFIHYFIDSDIKNKPFTYTLLARTSFKNLIKILESLSVQKSYSEKDALKTILDKCYRAEEIRNTIVHSAWSWGIRTKIKINRQKQLVVENEKLDADSLEKVANIIYKLDIILNHLLMKFVGIN